MKKIKIAVVFLGVALITSCSHRLTGNWNVASFENGSPGEQNITLHNIGSIHFNKNGTGEKNLKYVILGKEIVDNAPFNWVWNNGEYVSIESANSEFAKTWIIVENKKKTQVWKSTDGSSRVQVLELKK